MKSETNEMNVELSHKQTSKLFGHLRTVIMLDTGSTLKASMCNEDMLTDIKVSPKPIVMHTNGGATRMNLEGDLNGIGRVYYDSEQMANILGFAKLLEDPSVERIQFDSDI